MLEYLYTVPLQGSPGKYILISPPGSGSVGSGNGETISSSAPTTGGHSMLKSPGHRRIREGKKCRKVYGLEQRDLWCTQCKWKKACARFAKPSSASSAVASNSETSATSLLIPAGAAAAANSQNAVRAIKFWTTTFIFLTLFVTPLLTSDANLSQLTYLSLCWLCLYVPHLLSF